MPFYPNMHKLCKKVNTVKDSLLFSIQMNHIPGFGVAIQYGLPYLETGTDWNLTCMLFTLRAIVEKNVGEKKLPGILCIDQQTSVV